ncbi:MAG: LLM class flavin-dependent oxidoreductase [Actinomycetota bacterium]
MAADKGTATGLALAGSTTAGEGSSTRRVPLPFEDIAGAASLAEETSYEVLFVPDHGVWDPFSLLASLALRTSRLRLAPGVVTTTSRDPAAMAAAAVTLDVVSGGRAILGLGSGRERGIDRVAHAVEQVRRRLQGRRIPIRLAALGPRMVELAGRVADGVVLNWCTPERVARARAELARGAEAAGRDPGSVTVAVYVRACLGHDEAHALEALRRAAALYASLPSYRRQLDREGLGTDPDALVRALCVWGDRDEALDRLAAWREAGADLVVVYPETAQEPASSLMGTIMAAAPDPAVEH